MSKIEYFVLSQPDYNYHILERAAATEQCLAIRVKGIFVNNPDRTPDPYQISALSSVDQWTEECCRCIAIVGSGQLPNNQSTDHQRWLSFLGHISPDTFAGQAKETFRKTYSFLLARLCEQTITGTQQIIIAGGLHPNGYWPFSAKSYPNMIKEVSGISRKLGVPIYALPSKIIVGTETHIYRSNYSNTIYVIENGIPTASENPTRRDILVKRVS